MHNFKTQESVEFEAKGVVWIWVYEDGKLQAAVGPEYPDAELLTPDFKETGIWPRFRAEGDWR